MNPLFLFSAIMVRTYKRKTNRASTAPDTMLKAVRQVLVFKKTIRGAAEEFGINYRTLARYCTKIPREEVEGSAEHPSCAVGFIGARQVFSPELEAELVAYVLLASNVYYALPPRAIRKLAYQLAKSHPLQTPPSWRENKQASADWFASFLKRHPLLSIRMPEPASPASVVSRCHAEVFYSKLKALMERHRFRPEDMWIMEEMGITTAQRPDRVLARRGLKQMSPDRGPLVSVACTVSRCRSCDAALFCVSLGCSSGSISSAVRPREAPAEPIWAAGWGRSSSSTCYSISRDRPNASRTDPACCCWTATPRTCPSRASTLPKLTAWCCCASRRIAPSTWSARFMARLRSASTWPSTAGCCAVPGGASLFITSQESSLPRCRRQPHRTTSRQRSEPAGSFLSTQTSRG